MLDPGRTQVVIELAGEDEEPTSHIASRSGEDVGEFGNPIRPFLTSSEVGEGVGSFTESRDNCRDLMKGVAAWTPQDIGALGAAIVEGAMPVAGNPNGNLTDDRVVAAEWMMLFGSASTSVTAFCTLIAKPAGRPTPSYHFRPPLAARAGAQIAVMRRS
jgi:hypothetical protein